MYISVDIDPNELMGELEDGINSKAKLACDAEITKQFETIQKELEGVIIQHVDEQIELRMEEALYDMKDSLNQKMNDDLRDHVYNVVRKTVNDCLVNLRVVPYDYYLESGEGRAGKEQVMRQQYGDNLKKAEDIQKNWNDTIPCKGGCDARDTL